MIGEVILQTMTMQAGKSRAPSSYVLEQPRAKRGRADDLERVAPHDLALWLSGAGLILQTDASTRLS
jgi:hypothetical protein